MAARLNPRSADQGQRAVSGAGSVAGPRRRVPPQRSELDKVIILSIIPAHDGILYADPIDRSLPNDRPEARQTRLIRNLWPAIPRPRASETHFYRGNPAKGRPELSVRFELARRRRGTKRSWCCRGGEVGKVGVPICPLGGQMRSLFADIHAEQSEHLSMDDNGATRPGCLALLHSAVAEEQGADIAQLQGSRVCRNDLIKEIPDRGTYV